MADIARYLKKSVDGALETIQNMGDAAVDLVKKGKRKLDDTAAGFINFMETINNLLRTTMDPDGFSKFLNDIAEKFEEFILGVKVDLIVQGQRKIGASLYSNLPVEEIGIIMGRVLNKSELEKLSHYGVKLKNSEAQKGKYVLSSTVIDDLGNQSMDAKELKHFIDNLDDIVDQWKLRKAALARWSDKFDIFHYHYDGEIVVGKFSRRDRTPTLWMKGAHNYLVNGTKIRIGTIRKPPTNSINTLPNNVPFEANVDLIFSNRFIPKKGTSSFFPVNWTEKRVKGEIALVYQKLLDSGKFEELAKLTSPKFRSLDSNSEFEILIEFNKLGKLTNAYPIVK